VTYGLVPSTAQVMPEGHRGPRPVGRGALVAGGLAIVVLAVVGIVAWVVRDESGTGEALFVLPVPVGDWSLSNGAFIEPVPDSDAAGTDERFSAGGTLYGVADGDGFVGLRSMVRYRESPLPGADWERADTPWGDAYRRVDGSMTFALERYSRQGGDGWIVASSPSDLLHAYDMLANDTFDLAQVAYFVPFDTPLVPTTSFQMVSPDGLVFTVETAAGWPLFDVVTFAERIESVDVNGTPGWVVTDEGEDVTETIVTWRPESGRTISVRSSAPPDDVLDAARRLQPVSADEWTSTFPEAGAD
jgi:hypothetical protein